MSRNADNSSLKNDVINEYGFGAICLLDISKNGYRYQPEIWHAICLGMVLQMLYGFLKE